METTIVSNIYLCCNDANTLLDFIDDFLKDA